MLEQFNKQYKYKTDKQKFGLIEVWDVPKLQEDGFYYGDCEDYAIFLKNNIAGFENWNYYYCTLNNEGHCVLSDGVYIIDCNCQKIMRTYDYKDKYKVYEFKKYNRFTIFSKFVLGKLIKFYKGF